MALHRFVLPVKRLSTCCVALLLFSLPPWAAYIFPSQVGGKSEWYSTHRTGALVDEVDYLAVTLKVHPICYFHVFIFGMFLARTRYLVSVEIAKESSRAGIKLRRVAALSRSSLKRNAHASPSSPARAGDCLGSASPLSAPASSTRVAAARSRPRPPLSPSYSATARRSRTPACCVSSRSRS